MTVEKAVRFPVEPLLAWMRYGISDKEASEILGGAHNQVLRWRARGGLTAHAADEAACRLGLHPATIWGELWWTSALCSSCETEPVQLKAAGTLCPRCMARESEWFRRQQRRRRQVPAVV